MRLIFLVLVVLVSGVDNRISHKLVEKSTVALDFVTEQGKCPNNDDAPYFLILGPGSMWDDYSTSYRIVDITTNTELCSGPAQRPFRNLIPISARAYFGLPTTDDSYFEASSSGPLALFCLPNAYYKMIIDPGSTANQQIYFTLLDASVNSIAPSNIEGFVDPDDGVQEFCFSVSGPPSDEIIKIDCAQNVGE